MREKERARRPSPAMIVAIVALVFALAGTGVASVATISALSKKEKKQTRNIARDEIAKGAQPIAFAHVSAAGVLDSARSKNVGTVSQVFPGFYCITGVPFTPRGGQATVDQVGSNIDFAHFGFTKPDCQAYVETFKPAADTNDAAPFYVVLYG